MNEFERIVYEWLSADGDRRDIAVQIAERGFEKDSFLGAGKALQSYVEETYPLDSGSVWDYLLTEVLNGISWTYLAQRLMDDAELDAQEEEEEAL